MAAAGERAPAASRCGYSFGTVVVNAPLMVLPVRLLPDIETSEPPFAFSPVEFCVITLFEMRTVEPEPAAQFVLRRRQLGRDAPNRRLLASMTVFW